MIPSQKFLLPKTYLDRQNRCNSRYYFISYSHKDEKQIFELLNELYIKKVNYWYDAELDPGDIWNERVEGIITNPHCVGTIIFMSCNSLISDAVQQELKKSLEIREKRDSFRITPIIIGAKDAISLLNSVSEQNEAFYFSTEYDMFKNLVHNDVYIKFEKAKDSIISNSQMDNVMEDHYVNFRGSFIHELPHYSDGINQIYQLGKFPFEEDGQEKPIEWQLVANDDKLYYFVTKYCIDFVDKSNIEKTINEVKRTIHNRCLENISLIDEEFLTDYFSQISYALPTDYADRNRQQLLRLFWVRSKSDLEYDYSFFNTQNIKIEGKIKRDQLNAGIRLVMVINNNKIGGE